MAPEKRVCKKKKITSASATTIIRMIEDHKRLLEKRRHMLQRIPRPVQKIEPQI